MSFLVAYVYYGITQNVRVRPQRQSSITSTTPGCWPASLLLSIPQDTRNAFAPHTRAPKSFLGHTLTQKHAQTRARATTLDPHCAFLRERRRRRAFRQHTTAARAVIALSWRAVRLLALHAER